MGITDSWMVTVVIAPPLNVCTVTALKIFWDCASASPATLIFLAHIFEIQISKFSNSKSSVSGT